MSTLKPDCREEIIWDYEEGRYKEEAFEWFGDMDHMIGVAYDKAMIEDFQRFYACEQREPIKCEGIFFPEKCSSPPCDKCLGNISN